MPAPPSSGSEYIPAVDSLNEISDSGYERDDDWRPKVRIIESSTQAAFTISWWLDVSVSQLKERYIIGDL